MTTTFFRVYRGKGRNPRDFIAKVYASSAEEAIKEVRAQPAYRGKDVALEAVPAHPKPGK
jgi:hypothetical protein